MSCDSMFSPVFNDFQNLNSYPLIRADTYSKSGGNVEPKYKNPFLVEGGPGPKKFLVGK